MFYWFFSVFGNRQERIELIKLYIDSEGDAHEPGNIIDEETLQEMEKLKDVWENVDPEEHSVLKKEIEKQIAKDKAKNRLNT